MYQSLFNSLLATAAAGASRIKDATVIDQTAGETPPAAPDAGGTGNQPVNESAIQSAVTPGNSEKADQQAFNAMKEKLEQYERQEQTRKARIEHLRFMVGGTEDE